jgi:hypothetical protein
VPAAYRRRLRRVAFLFLLAFFLALGRLRLALRLVAFRFAFCRRAFFFGLGAGARIGSGAPIGAGIGGAGGADGNIGSIIPGPVQPLSVTSRFSSIGSLLRW